MQTYSTEQFLEECDVRLDKEFEYDGVIASWTADRNGPCLWDQEDEIIPAQDDFAGNRRSITLAASLDGSLLAVATCKAIRIYDAETLGLLDLLLGHTTNIGKLVFAETRTQSPSGHILLSNSDNGLKAASIYAWSLDNNGRLKDECRIPHFDSSNLATKSVEAIKGDLSSHNVDEKEFIEIQEKIEDVLKRVNARNVVKNIKKIDGSLNGFGSSTLSNDGTRFLYEAHGMTTQHGMRSEEELPQIVVMRLEPFEEVCRLQGHSDAIMWNGWSPDDKVIATASWDQTFRIWDAGTGECKRIIGPTDGQNWAGKFLSDGKHILLSGGRGASPLGLFNYESGERIAVFAPEAVKLDHWLRYFTSHPREDLAVIQNGRTLLAWKPLSASTKESPLTTESIFAFKADEAECSVRDTFTNINQLAWVAAEDIFIARGSEGSTFVWDKTQGLKWRFQRQRGRSIAGHTGNALLVKRKGGSYIASADGDGAARLWKL